MQASKKLCSRCNRTKLIRYFHKDSHRIDGLFPYCKECRREREGLDIATATVAVALTARDKVRELDRKKREELGEIGYARAYRRKYLWSTYRLTLSAYDNLRELQGFSCNICGRHEDTLEKGSSLLDNKRAPLQVDHDRSCCSGTRSCGRCIRGLLCGRCNTGLGQFRDSTEFLSNAITYLIHHHAVDNSVIDGLTILPYTE